MRIKGNIRTGVPTLLGVSTIKALSESDGAASSKRFVNKPRLSKTASKNIKAKFLSLKKDVDGNIIEYKFNIIYTSTGKTNKKTVDIKWVYKTEDIPAAKIKKINKLISGPKVISKNGESRRIVIQGDPGAEFAVAINESFIEEEEEGGEVIKTLVIKGEDVSILRKGNATTSDGYGKDIPIIKGTVPSTGTFYFTQDFPSNVIKRTRTTHPISSSATLKCNTDGLKVGDRLLTSNKSITGGTNVIKIQTVDSTSQVTLDTTISTLAQYSNIQFTRNRNYSINLVPELTPHVADSVLMGDDVVLSKQEEDPILSITNLVRDIAINGASAGVDFVVKATGRANSVPIDNIIKVQLICTRGTAFSCVNPPKLKAYDSDASWFTNVGVMENGGTHLELVKFDYSGVGTTTVTINYELKIVKWGSKDVNVELDVDNPTDATRQVVQF